MKTRRWSKSPYRKRSWRLVSRNVPASKDQRAMVGIPNHLAFAILDRCFGILACIVQDEIVCMVILGDNVGRKWKGAIEPEGIVGWLARRRSELMVAGEVIHLDIDHVLREVDLAGDSTAIVIRERLAFSRWEILLAVFERVQSRWSRDGRLNEGSQSGDDRKEVLQSQVDHFGNFVIVVAVFAKRLTS